MNRLIFIALLVVTLIGSACQTHSDSKAAADINNPVAEVTHDHRPIVDQNENSSPAALINTSANYIGCWSGMKGAQLRITADTIYDLNSGETAQYLESTRAISRRSGMQTGESYLLELSKSFRRSFEVKFIELAYNSDDTVGITSYETYESYLEDKFVGMGLYEMVSC